MKKVIIAALVGCLTACGGGGGSPTTQVETPKYVIVTLGDSETAGWVPVSGLQPQLSWPTVLENTSNFKVINLGIPGSDTRQLYAQQFNKAMELKPNAVIITTGINDVYHNISIDESKQLYSSMIYQFKQKGIKVYVGTPLHFTTFDLEPKLEEFAKVVRTMDAQVIDFRAQEKPTWFCSSVDSHPCEYGYKEMAKVVLSNLIM